MCDWHGGLHRGSSNGRACFSLEVMTVRLIAPQFVKPYVKSNKTDANDAEAICEAMSRPHMRFVTVKSVAQQDIQATQRSSFKAQGSTQRQGQPDPRPGGGVRTGCTAIVAGTSACHPRLARRCRERSDRLLPFIVARSLGRSSDSGGSLQGTRQGDRDAGSQQRSHQAIATVTRCRTYRGNCTGGDRR